MKKLSSTRYWQQGRDFLGVRFPIISGAMTWISDSTLVKAVSDAGGFGVLAAGNMPTDLFKEELIKLRDRKANFAANLITIAPNYTDHLAACIDVGVNHIVFAGSFPRKSEIKTAKESGAKVTCFASTKSIAQRMIDYGTDALILEGSEAGGHIGHVSTIVLIQQVLFNFPDIPIFVAGGIATGKMISHLFIMGASGVQMGTIFAMSEESPAHPVFKERYLRARSREAMSTPQYDSSLPVVAVRALKNRGMDNFGKLQLELLGKLQREEISRIDAQYEVEKYWMGALRRAVVDGDIKEGSLMAGQSVGLIHEIKSVAKIISDLVEEAELEFERTGHLFV
jgi:enoyl-[acyl-carrier protein] reductase II